MFVVLLHHIFWQSSGKSKDVHKILITLNSSSFFFLTGLTLPSSSRKDNRPRHCTSAVRISAVLQQSPSVEGLALRASGSDFSKINIYLAISPLLQTINNVSLKPCLPLVWLMMLVKLLSAAVWTVWKQPATPALVRKEIQWKIFPAFLCSFSFCNLWKLVEEIFCMYGRS